MKKTFLFLFFAIFACSFAVFAQETQPDTFAEALKGFGISGTLAGLISFAVVTIAGWLIPNKYAAITLYIEKICYAAYLLFAKINEKVNKQSAKQIAKSAKKVVPIIILLLCFGVSNAQSPFKGFFDNKKSVLQKNFTERSTDTLSTSTSGTFLFRGSATVAGFAVPLKSSEEVSSFQIAGMGLTYGYWTSSTYCKYAINAFAVSSLKLGDLTSAKAGGLVTIGFFNNYFNVGLMYAAPSDSYNWYLTTGLTYTF